MADSASGRLSQTYLVKIYADADGGVKLGGVEFIRCTYYVFSLKALNINY